MDYVVRQKIWEELSRRGRMTRDEVMEFARKDKWYKESTIERRLRSSESPFVKAIENGKGYVIAYEWIGLTPYKVETKDDKKRREAREREDKMLALAREGKLAF